MRRVTGLPGVFHADASRDRDLELAAEEAVRRVNECARAGVRYAIEPHLDSIGENVDGTRAFLDASEWLTLTLDYGHFITSGETSDRYTLCYDSLLMSMHGEAPSEDSKPRLMKTQSTFPACWLDCES